MENKKKSLCEVVNCNEKYTKKVFLLGLPIHYCKTHYEDIYLNFIRKEKNNINRVVSALAREKGGKTK